MTLRELVIRAIEELMVQGKSEFEAAEICEEALKIDPERKRRSVLGTLPGLVVGRRHPVYTEADQFLEKVRHGVYQMYVPPEKPVPQRRGRRKKR